MEGGYTSMSNTTVDNRVVNMQFNNAQFEAGVKQTIKSLDELKKSLDLNTSATGLSTLQRSFDSFSLKNMEQNIESLAQRFSTLGIVGMTVIQNLTNEVTNFVKNKLSAAYNQILTGGWNRASTIAQARFTMQGLFANEVDGAEKVEQAMKAAGDAVTDTAYTMSSAAGVASQLAASNITEYEDLKKTLTAIAGVASQTGDSYDNIGHIFTTVAGNGRLMGMQLTQLSMHGLNAAAILAKSMGTTEEAVREAVSKGEISFQQFSDAMYDAFGTHAKDANKTFSGTMDNIKAQLSKIGEIFSTGIIENENVINFLNDVMNALKSIKNVVSPLGEPFKNLMSAMSNFGRYAIAFFDTAGISNFVEIVGKGMETLTRWINTFLEQATKFRNSDFVKGVEAVVSSVEKIQEVTQAQADIAEQIWNGPNIWGNGAARKKAIEEQGEDYDAIQSYLNDYIKAGGDVEKMTIKVKGATTDASKESKNAMGEVAESAETAADAFNPLRIILSSIMTFGEGIHLIFETVKNTVKAVGKSFKKVFSIFDIAENIAFFGETFSKLVSIFAITDERAEKLERAFAGLWAVIDILRRVFQGVVTVLVDTFGPVLSLVFDLILDIAATIGDVLSDFNAWEKETGVLSTIFKILATVLSNVIKFVVEFVKKLADMPIIQKVKDAIGELASMIGDNLGPYLKDALEWLEKFFDGLNNADTSFVDTVIGKINDGLEFMIGLFVLAKEKVEDFFDWIFGNEKAAGGAGGAIKDVSNGIDNIKNSAEAVTKNDSFGKFFSKIKSGMNTAGDGIVSFTDKVVNFFKTLDYSKVAAIGISAAVGMVSVSLGKLMWNMANVVKNISGIGSSIKGTFGEISHFFKDARKTNNRVKMLKAWALIIAVLTASLIALTKVDTDKLITAGIVLAGIITVLGIFTAIMTKVASKVEDVLTMNTVLDSMTKVILALGVSVFLLSYAIVSLSDVEWSLSKFLWTFSALAVSMGILVASTILISKFAPNISRGGLVLIALAAAIYILVKALKILANLDLTGVQDHVVILIEIVAGLALFALAASKIKWHAALNLLGMVAAIYILELALWYITYAGVSWKDVKEHISNYIVILSALVILAGILTAVAKIGGEHLGKASSGILKVALALIPIGLVIKMIGNMKLGNAIQGVVAIMAIMWAIMKLMATMAMLAKLDGDYVKAGKAMKKIATAIALLALVVVVLGVIPLKILGKGILIVGLLTLCMMGLLYMSGKAKDVDYKSLLAMVAVIAAMVASIAVLSILVKDDIVSVLAAMGILGLSLIAFAASFMIASKYADKLKKGPLIIMVAAILVIVGSLVVLMQYPIKNLIAATIALASLMLMIGIVMKVFMSSFENSKGGTRTASKNRMLLLAEMIGMVVFIAAALGELVKATGDNTTALVVSALLIIALIATLTIAIAALNNSKHKKFSNDYMMTLALTILSIAVIAEALKTVISAGGDLIQMISAVVAIGLLLVAIAGMMAFLSGMKAKIDTSTVIALAVAVAGVVAIAYALKQILSTDTDWSQMLSAAGSLVLVMVAVAAALGILTAISSSGAGALAVILSAVAIAVVLGTLAFTLPKVAKGIKALAVALAFLANVDFDLGMFIKLVLIFAALAIGAVVVGAALLVLAAGLLAVSIALAAAGVAALLIAAAFWVFSKALEGIAAAGEKMGKSMPSVASGIKEIGSAIKDSAIDIAEGIALAIISFAKTIVDNKQTIFDAIDTVIDIIVRVVTAGMQIIVETIVQKLIILLNAIGDLAEPLIGALAKIFIALGEHAEEFGYYGALIIGGFLGGVIDAIDENQETIAEKVTKLVVVLGKIMWKVITGALKELWEFIKKWGTRLEATVTDWFSMDTGEDGLYAKMADKAQAELDRLVAVRDKLKAEGKTDEEVAYLSRSIRAYELQVEELRRDSKTNYDRVVEEQEKETMETMDKEAQEAKDKYTDDLLDATDVDLSSSAKSTSDSYFKSLQDGNSDFSLENLTDKWFGKGNDIAEDEAQELVETFTKTVTKQMSTADMPEEAIRGYLKQGWHLDETGEFLEKKVQEQMDGVEVATAGLVNVTQLYDTMGKVAEDLKSLGIESGKDYLRGVKEGLKDITLNSTIRATSEQIGKGVDDSFRKGLEEESPSKKGVEAGAFYIEGVDIGLRKMATVPLDTANSVAVGLVKTFGATVSSIYSTIDNIDAIQPTITPVLDTTNIQQANALMGIDNLNTQANIMFQNSPQATLAAQVQALSEQVKKLAETDYSTMLEGVNINVDASTKVDGTPLRQMASTYTIEQIDENQRGLILATGGRV